MTNRFTAIDSLNERLKKLLPMKPEDKLRLDKKFRLEFSYNSNHIEGNTLTYVETELLLIFGDTQGNHTMRELEEMKAHDVAYKLIEEWAHDEERPLTEQQIKNLNEIILVQPYWKDAITPSGQHTRRQIKVGDYKEQPNSVILQNGEIFHYASPMETPAKMQELIEWYREAEHTMHPVELAALLHYKFVLIHPFDDGNGRVSRLLMNYVLIKHGLPTVIIKTDDKENYRRALNRADAGDIDAFVDYIALQLKWSLEISIKAAEGEGIDEPGDFEKRLALLKKKVGQDNEEKVRWKYNLRNVITVVQSLRPLIDKWEIKNRELDILFYSRTCQLLFDDRFVEGGDMYDTLYSVAGSYFGDDFTSLEIDETKPINLRRISILASFHRLRALRDNVTYGAGGVAISFHDNFYEIRHVGSETPITKLYHEVLSEQDIDNIVDSMGNWFLTTIEQALEK